MSIHSQDPKYPSLDWTISEDPTRNGVHFQQLQVAIMQAIWGFMDVGSRRISPLVEIYLDQIELIDPDKLHVSRHRDVVEIVDFVRGRASLTRAVIRDKMKSTRPDWLGNNSKSADAAIDLVIRVWLFCDPCMFQDDDCIIVDQMSKEFPKADNDAPLEEFELHFDTNFLKKVADIEVVWTQYLTQHLQYDRKYKVLYLFDATDILRTRYNEQEQTRFPIDLLVETQKTLVLLFPPDRAESNSIKPWRTRHDVERALSRRILDLQNPATYVYWRDRLITLHGVYAKAQPSRLTQLWRDRRDTNQWTTLWLAVLVIFLTLVFGLIMQSITGIIQVVIASRPTKQS